MYKMITNCERNNTIDTISCRACLESNNEGFVSLKNKSELSQLFEFCVGISVEPDDMYQILCQTCATIVKKFADFKVQCHRSHEILKSIANNRNNISTIEEVNVESNCDLDILNLIQNEYSSDNKESNHDFNIKDMESQNNDKDIIEKAIRKSCRQKNMTNTQIMYEEKNNTEQGAELIKVLECSKCKKQYRICRFSSSRREDLVVHLSEHWNKNDLCCKLCSYVGRDLAELFGHRSVHQPYVFFSKSANRICHICDKTTSTIKTQQFHYRSVHLKKDGGLCSVCQKTFRSYTAWRNHERLHKEGKYICDLCGNKFLFRSIIKAHMAEHANVRENICHICGKAFKRASYLKVHFNTVHIKEPVKCTHCNKTFKSPASLKDHLKYVNKEKKFQCDICFKYFASELSLKKHKFWHTEMRPFSCKDCGIKYKAKSYLKIHMRKHTGQRPYTCDQCDKCFPTSMQLKRHKIVHTGERPHKCKNCNQSFYYKKQLLRHVSLKHKEAKLEIN
ncbi:PREDICTED: zinc finger protein 320-like isoform X2 [Papilio xuthus]|uniref:Zinc finger protein 320-like isoform X2 n=1 Tax=Papilio xuthus TaxID=66420 RepID=A0AAJ6ZN95_PAPXU|nr:PREDICTED: zinc finger protein 320-like isoform X2 [Papilio xuthus]